MSPIGREIRRLTALATPLAVSQFGAMFLWVVDTLMLGQVSVEDLDAASLGRTWVMATTILGSGCLMGLDPLAAQAFGSGNRPVLLRTAQRGLVTAAVLTLPLGALWLATGPALTLLGQDPELVERAVAYVDAQLPGLPCFLAYVVLRQWLQAQGVMRPVMWISLSANLVNALANWVLIFGNWGAPALGATGAGMATAITFAYLAGATAWTASLVLGREHSPWKGWTRASFSPVGVGRILTFGIPIGIQISLELWAFSLTTLWAGQLGAVPLAAHTVAIAVASTTFMIPLGIAFATTTRVGNLIGAGDREGAQRAAWVATGLAAVTMVVSAVLLIVGRRAIPDLFTDDPTVITACAAILPIAAAFQLSDGIQAVGGGVLRGMGKPVPAALFNLLGYWILTLPLGWYLAFRTDLALAGLWWAMALGLTIIAALLMAWIAYRGPATVEAVELGDA